MRKDILLSSSAIAVLFTLTAAPASAQDTEAKPTSTTGQSTSKPDDGRDTLGDIVVTARRVEENLQRVPVAVTTLSSNQLEQRNVGAVADLQFNIPNLQIKPSTIYPSQVEFIVRGQRQVLFTDENVVTYVNGVPQTTRGLSLFDMQSVQALKGPQGTLFGKNSMGGAMVFTTRRPSDVFTGEASMEYGNYNLMKADLAVNFPLAKGVALRVAGEIERRDGIFKNVYPGQQDLGNRNNQAVRGTLLINPGDRFENLTTVDYKSRQEIPFPAIIEAAPLNATGFGGLLSLVTQQIVALQSQLGGGTPLTQGGLLIRQGNPFITRAFTGVGTLFPAQGSFSPFGSPLVSSNTNGSDVVSWGVANSTTFKATDQITLKNIFGYRYERAFDHSDPAGTQAFQPNLSLFLNCLFAGATCNAGIPSPFPGYVADNNVNYYNKIKQLSDEVQVIGKFDNLDVIGGLFYSNTKVLYSVNAYFTVGPLSLYDVRSTMPYEGLRHGQANFETNSYAVFAQGTYNFSGIGLNGVRLTLGGRYTWDKRDYFSENFYTENPAQLLSFASTPGGSAICNEVNGTAGGVTGVNNGSQCSISGNRTFKAFTYTASLEYQASPETLLYAATRRGYKAGGATPTTRVLSFTFYNPETITDYELGLKHQGYLGKIPFRFNVAGFIGKYKNIQTQNILTFCVDQVACNVTQGTYTDLINFNVGNATIKGVEIDASIKPFRDLTIDGGFSYQVGRYGSGSRLPQPTDPTQGAIYNGNPIDLNGGFDLSGKEFAGLARTTLNVSATYQPSWVPESVAKPALSVTYSYRSSAKGLAVQGVYPWPSFGIWGARFALNEIGGSRVSAAFWMQNIGNDVYKIYCADNLNSIGYASCRYGEPRTYGATLSFKW